MKKQVVLPSLCRGILITISFLAISMLMGYLPLPSPFFEFVQLVIYLLLAWIFTKNIDKSSWSSLRLKIDKNALKGFTIAFIIIATLVSVGSLLSRNIFHEPVFHLQGKIDFWSVLLILVSFFVAAFVNQGIPEEIIFRGYLVQTFSKRYTPLITMMLSVGFFTLIHGFHIFREGLTYGLLTMFYAFSFACLAYILQFLFNTTWAAIAVHGGLHMTRLSLQLVGFSDTSGAMLIQSIIILISSLILLMLFRDKFQSKI